MAASALIFDEARGRVTESYNRGLLWTMLMLRYYTDLDLQAYDTPDGRYALYDILQSNGALEKIREWTEKDLWQVEDIYHRICYSATRNFECEHSLEHKLIAMLGDLGNGESFAQAMEKAETLTKQVLDLRRSVEGAPREVRAENGLIRFAKRD